MDKPPKIIKITNQIKDSPDELLKTEMLNSIQKDLSELLDQIESVIIQCDETLDLYQSNPNKKK